MSGQIAMPQRVNSAIHPEAMSGHGNCLWIGSYANLRWLSLHQGNLKPETDLRSSLVSSSSLPIAAALSLVPVEVCMVIS